MDKLTYLAELAEGLARWVPERERQDILRYYAEYFEEAGPDREAEVIQELGDPWALSSRLAVEGGYVTQTQADLWTPPKKKKWPWVLAGAAAVLVLLIGSVAAMISQLVGSIHFERNVETFVTGETTVVGQVDVTSEAPLRPGSGEVSGEGGGFWNEADGTLDSFVSIDAEVSLANVTVTEGEDFTLSISSDSTLGGYSLRWEVKNGVLKVRDAGGGHMDITSWEDFKNMFGVNASAMDVGITVPSGVRLTELKIKTGLGDVFLSQLDVEKKLEAETGLGDIECYEVEAWDEVDLETGMGDVTLGVEVPYSGVEYDLKTGMGTIEAQLNALEKDWDFEAKTGMGTVTLNGDSRGTKLERKGKGDYKLEAETGMGDINLYFQDDRW